MLQRADANADSNADAIDGYKLYSSREEHEGEPWHPGLDGLINLLTATVKSECLNRIIGRTLPQTNTVQNSSQAHAAEQRNLCITVAAKPRTV